jgi:hypothetical protein
VRLSFIHYATFNSCIWLKQDPPRKLASLVDVLMLEKETERGAQLLMRTKFSTSVEFYDLKPVGQTIIG